MLAKEAHECWLEFPSRLKSGFWRLLLLDVIGYLAKELQAGQLGEAEGHRLLTQLANEGLSDKAYSDLASITT